jgi:hypothetical protein
MDVYTLLAPDSTWADRGMSVLSLGTNVFTLGLSPNFGGVLKAGRQIKRATAPTGKAGSKIEEAAEQATKHKGATPHETAASGNGGGKDGGGGKKGNGDEGSGGGDEGGQGGGNGGQGDGDSGKKGVRVTRDYSKLSKEELGELSKKGDKRATYEKNKRKVEEAKASGDPRKIKDAHGAAIENKIADELGDKVIKAGEIVKYPNPNKPDRTLRSEIDLETNTEVIQIKSGGELPDTRQIETTIHHAQLNGKTPVVYYNASRISSSSSQTLENYRKNYPSVILRPRTDFDP